MSRAYTFLMTFVATVMLAVAANATTLATFSISDGTWDVAGGEVITITGNFDGDASGLLAADPFTPLPLVFGADLSVNGNTVFSGDTGAFGPISASPEDLFFAALGLGVFLDDITSGGFSAAVDYLVDGAGRVDTLDVFDLGVADLFFSYTGGVTGPGTLSGSFTAILTGTSQSPDTLSDFINGGLFELGLIGSGGPLQGFEFPTNANGTFGADFSIAAVPLPAGVWLLGAGLFGLALFRRRRAEA